MEDIVPNAKFYEDFSQVLWMHAETLDSKFSHRERAKLIDMFSDLDFFRYEVLGIDKILSFSHSK